MNFINCSVPLSTDKGLHVVSSGCGSEKTTMIQEIIQEKMEGWNFSGGSDNQ